VLGADGKTCLPALNATPDQNPFFGVAADKTPQLSRVPNMHGQYDDVMTVVWPMGGSDMSTEFFIGPWTLMMPTKSMLMKYTGAPHGNPSSDPFITLDVVTGGGQACP
jgi:hypothetical protein